MLQILRDFADSGDEVQLIVPGMGFVAAKIESVTDDAVIVSADRERLVLHYSAIVVRTPEGPSS